MGGRELFALYQGTPPVPTGMDLGEDGARVQEYVTPGRYPWPFTRDPDQQVTRAYPVAGTPTHGSIRRDGVIDPIAVGDLDPQPMEE